MGIHTSFTEAKADAIVEQLREGIPLREICRQDNMPQWRTVYDWIRKDPDFATRIALAREDGYDCIAEECLHIANTPEPTTKTEILKDPDGNVKWTKTIEFDNVDARKLKIDLRLKLLAKWNPKKYGDRPMDNNSKELVWENVLPK
jgi:hypothetical protein